MIVMLTLTVLVHQLQLPWSYDGQCYTYKPTLNGEGGAGYPVKRSPIGYMDVWEVPKWRPTPLPKLARPTFSPYIGAGSLTDIPSFFQLLRENVDAIFGEKGARGSKLNGKDKSRPKPTKASFFGRSPVWPFTSRGFGKRQN